MSKPRKFKCPKCKNIMFIQKKDLDGSIYCTKCGYGRCFKITYNDEMPLWKKEKNNKVN